MIQSSRNQLATARNPYQGKTTKVLCVCSAGLLRSPTIATILTKRGYNTRACGIATEYALVPISTALLEWADVVVYAEDHHRKEVHDKELSERYRPPAKLVVLHIPDEYGYMDPELVKLVEDGLDKAGLT